jgi:hypothetical protein
MKQVVQMPGKFTAKQLFIFTRFFIHYNNFFIFMRIHRKTVQSTAIIAVIAFISGFSLFSEDISYRNENSTFPFFPENDEARLSCKEDLQMSLDNNPWDKRIIRQSREKINVLFRTDKTKESLIYLFLNETNKEYSLGNTGNVSLRRSRKDGRFAEMTVILRENDGCYARLYPSGNKTVLSVFFFGSLFYRDIVVPYKFENVIFGSFGSLMNMTALIIDWKMIFHSGNVSDYEKLCTVVNRIRKKMPLLGDTDDGAIDKNGRFVYIKNGQLQDKKRGLNCSGFVKWVIDGFYFPKKNTFTDIGALKEKQFGYRGNAWTNRFEEERDPFFGLDWSRNCAIALDEARTGVRSPDPEAFDVRNIPYSKYLEDVGYPVSDTELVLFLALSERPGEFYIGSINTDMGKNPVLHEHFHLVLFFPYFDESGKFGITVLSRNKEISFDSYLRSYKSMYVHLVRIGINGEFDLRVP